MLTARIVILVQRIGGPARFIAHQSCPAAEQPVADHMGEYVTVESGEYGGRGGRLHAIAAAHPVPSGCALFREMRAEGGQRGSKQSSFDLLAKAGALPVHQRGEGAECGQHRGAKIDVRRRPLDRRTGRSGYVHGTGHGLSHTVETTAIGIGAPVPERTLGHQDDAGPYRTKRRVIDSHVPQLGGREIRDHDIRGRHEAFDDLPRFGFAGIERDGFLVAGGLKKYAPFAAIRHRCDVPVLAAVATLDADDLGAQVSKQGCTIGTGDVATEVQHPQVREHAGRRRGSGFHGNVAPAVVSVISTPPSTVRTRWVTSGRDAGAPSARPSRTSKPAPCNGQMRRVPRSRPSFSRANA
jgi:hypothetical protein